MGCANVSSEDEVGSRPPRHLRLVGSLTGNRELDAAWERLASDAERTWDGLADEEITGIWRMPLAAYEETVVECVVDCEDTAAQAMPPLPSDEGPHTRPFAAPMAARIVQVDWDDDTALAERVLAVGDEIEVPAHDAPDAVSNGDAGSVRLASDFGGLRVVGGNAPVWLRLDDAAWLRDGDRVRVGEHELVFADADGSAFVSDARDGYRGRLHTMVGEDCIGAARAVFGAAVSVGREIGGLAFPRDTTVSARHCRFVPARDGVYVEDLGSRNGTWLRLREGDSIPWGSVLEIGDARLRVEPVTVL